MLPIVQLTEPEAENGVEWRV